MAFDAVCRQLGIGLVFWGVAEPISHYGSSMAGVAVGKEGVRTGWAPWVLVLGPTATILTGFFDRMIEHVVALPALSNRIGRGGTNFMQGWTTFYWAWWISWSPFVGMFIARVSRGCTVRDFVICVILIPAVVGALTMSVFTVPRWIGFCLARGKPCRMPR